MFEQLEKELDNREFHTAYLILGEEDFLVRKALQLFRSKVVPPEVLAFNFAEFSAKEASMTDILSYARTYPMMSSVRLAIVTDIDGLQSVEQQMLASYLGSPNPLCVLVLQAAQLDKRTSLFRTAKDRTFVIECSRLKGAALVHWAEQHVRRRGLKLSRSAIEKLVDHAGSDLQTLVNECEKLQLYAGPEGRISESSMDDLISSSRQRSIFELTDAIERGDRTIAMQMLRDLLQMGEPSLLVLAMVARHFRQVIIAKELLLRRCSEREIMRTAQIPPFLVKRFLGHVNRSSLDRMAKLYLRAAEADRRIKSSHSDPQLILENLVCSL